MTTTSATLKISIPPDHELIEIYQKTWAFTTSTSSRPHIKSDRFGSGYIVSFISGKFVAMTHIVGTTDVNLIADIFAEFKINAIEPSDVSVTITGGWTRHTDSFECAKEIFSKIHDYHCKEVNTKHMLVKRGFSMHEEGSGLYPSDREAFCQGAVVSATTGKTYLLTGK